MTDEGGPRSKFETATAPAGRMPITKGLARPPRLPAWLTLELLAYVAVLAVAAALRFVGLGETALSAAEAERALAAWHVVRGEPVDLAHGPTFVYGTALVIFMLGANDATVRLVPAVAGLWIAAWPFLARRQLGRPVALATAFLLALSPSLVATSRAVAGESLALGLVLLAALGWLRFAAEGKPYQLTIAGVALGLALGCGPAAFSLLLPLAVLGAIVALLGEMEGRIPHGWPWMRLAIGLAVALVLISTGFLSQPGGLQAGVLDAARLWTAGLPPFASGWDPLFLPLAIVVYEPLLLATAVVAPFVVPPDRRGQVGLWGAWAFLAGLFGAFWGGALVGAPALVAFPLALAGGHGLAAVWRRSTTRLSLREAGLFLLLALPAVGLWVTVAGFLAWSPGRLHPGFLAAAPAYLVLVAAGWAYLRGPASAGWGLATLALVVLAAFGLRSSVQLAHYHAANPGEMAVVSAPSADLRNLVEELEANSAVLSTPGRRDLGVAIERGLRYPLAWYLRDFAPGEMGDSVPTARAIVASSEVALPPGEYRYQRYTVATSTDYRARTLGQMWRWWLYREFDSELTRQDVHLYVALRARP